MRAQIIALTGGPTPPHFEWHGLSLMTVANCIIIGFAIAFIAVVILGYASGIPVTESVALSEF